MHRVVLASWQPQPCKSTNTGERHEAIHTRVVMSWRNKSYFGCPALKSGKTTCEHGCTENWPMCHMFLNNKCYAQHLPEYCCKGYHVRPNEPPKKKRRVEEAAAENTVRTEHSQTKKQTLRLIRLGFFDSQLPTRDALEKAYTVHREDVRKSLHSSEDKVLQIKKLKSAFRNIGKALQNRASSPSTDDEDRAARTPGRAYA